MHYVYGCRRGSSEATVVGFGASREEAVLDAQMRADRLRRNPRLAAPLTFYHVTAPRTGARTPVADR